jgi:methionyl-tRNA formyltransferase
MTGRLFFVLNSLDDFDFGPLLDKYLPTRDVHVGCTPPASTGDYRLVVLWNNRKIVANLPERNNFILFHSSDLPAGKGWAPIYYVLAEGNSHYTISGILASPQVDSGDLIVKARFPILPNYTATDLRKFDAEISMMLLAKILEKFEGEDIVGIPQSGSPTYRKRRCPEDNVFDIERPFRELIPHFRACEPAHPAVFDWEGVRYRMEISCTVDAEFPPHIEIDWGNFRQ